MADDTERDSQEGSGPGPCLSPLGLLAIICGEAEAIELMQRRLQVQLDTLHLVLTNADFNLCIGILNYLEKRFPDEQLVVFKRACDMAENTGHLGILEDYLQRIPSEITGYAMREWERACERILNPEDEEGSLNTGQGSGRAEETETPPKSEEPPASSGFAV
ncbi:MAG: hypothetical protein WCT25_00010 [Candidatus Paceibacterota bacterium]|jgi:hypothetical protein